MVSEVAKVKVPFEPTARSSPPLLRSMRPVPVRPVTVPPIVYLFPTQLTETLVTLAPATAPEPFETVQV